jgi:hypothetical protein
MRRAASPNDHAGRSTAVMNNTHPGNRADTITVVILSKAMDLQSARSATNRVGSHHTSQ